MKPPTALVIALFLTAASAPARTNRSSTNAIFHVTATNSNTGKSSQSKAAKGKSSSRTGVRSRKSGPPRQTAPTPERYMEIQQALADKGYYSGPIDGAWTPDCVQALKRFQQDQNLDPDGKLGALSIIALGLGPKREAPPQGIPQQFVSKPEVQE